MTLVTKPGMRAAVEAWVPAELPVVAAVFLVVLCALTGFITAAFGLGGGIVYLAAMAFFVPAGAILPVHGVIQLGTNVGRSLLLLTAASFVHLAWFAPGMLLGVTVGGFFSMQLPSSVLRGLVGLFALYMAWRGGGKSGSNKRLPVSEPVLLFGGGFVSSLLTMFVGATGPFVVAFIMRLPLERLALVSTVAVAMLLQHGGKSVAFGLYGFDFVPWIPFMSASIASGLVGTYLGVRVLKQTSDDRHRTLLRAVLAFSGSLLVLKELWDLI